MCQVYFEITKLAYIKYVFSLHLQSPCDDKPFLYFKYFNLVTLSLKMKKISFVVCLIFISVLTKAQDPHFSQFFASPLTLNPALTGKFDGQIRLAADYRNQWPSISNAYITESGSVDMSILKKKLGNNVLGIGFSGLSDQSANGALNLNYGSASISYHQALDGTGYNTLGVGFQGTYSSLSIDQSKLVFEDQILSGGSPTQEVFTNGTNKNYFDMAAGILFSGSTDGLNNYYAGISMYHINTPDIGFYTRSAGTNNATSGFLLKPRTTVHAGALKPLTDNLKLVASGIVQLQNDATEALLGAAICANVNNSSIDNDDDVNVYLGSWVRLGDAIIPYASLEFSGLRIGLSYDVNTSRLKTASQSKGGIELSLIYIRKRDTDNSIPCPSY